jgi:hypothetical protein
MTSSLDRRSTVRNSGWHWGDGVQHEAIHDLAALQEELTANSGISGLEVVDPAEPGFASRAAKLFHRDGFVCIKDALTPEHLAALRVRCEDAMHAIVGADQFGGAKGAWRYMFGGSSITNSCMHFPEYAQLSALPTVDPVLTEIWGTPDYICYVRVPPWPTPATFRCPPPHPWTGTAGHAGRWWRFLPARQRVPAAPLGLWGRFQAGA